MPSSDELAPVRADQPRQQLLLVAREARHVGVLEQVAAVVVIAAVRDVEPDLVQARGPHQRKLAERIVAAASSRCTCASNCSAVCLDARGLLQVDVVAPLHRADRALARVLVVKRPSMS